MKHTFLIQEGTWKAEGSYYDEEGNHYRTSGETKITHEDGRWLNESWMRIFEEKTVEFTNSYEIKPLDEGADRTGWTSRNPAIGRLKGNFFLVEDTIFSVGESENGNYRCFEALVRMDEVTYRNRGITLRGDKRISSWSVTLRKIS
jgi:hypothetical protein